MASKIEKLKEDYKNKQPLLLNGTYVNSDDKAYENTYKKLMWLFYLEERYTNKKLYDGNKNMVLKLNENKVDNNPKLIKRLKI